MEWAQKGTGNTNPVVIVNGDIGLEPLKISVSQGDTVLLDASRSFDPEGDGLTYSWWQQMGLGQKVRIDNADTPTATVYIGEDKTGPIHIVCEVHDDGEFNLVGYRRVILMVGD